jgi:hypothetical protein
MYRIGKPDRHGSVAGAYHPGNDIGFVTQHPVGDPQSKSIALDVHQGGKR